MRNMTWLTIDDCLHLLAPGKSWNFAKESVKINFGFVFAKKIQKKSWDMDTMDTRLQHATALFFGLVRLGLDKFRVSSSIKSCNKHSVFGLNSESKATGDRKR